MRIRKLKLQDFLQLAEKQIEERIYEDLGPLADEVQKELQRVVYGQRILELFLTNDVVEVPMEHFNDIVYDILNNEYTLG